MSDFTVPLEIESILSSRPLKHKDALNHKEWKI